MTCNTATAFIFTTLLILTNAQDDNTVKPNVDILRLKFIYNSTKIANLTIDLLSSMDYKKYTNETIYLKDILNFVGISEESDSDFDISRFQINMTSPFDDKNIETAFSKLNISISDSFTSFVLQTNCSISDVRTAFNAIGLNFGDMNDIVLYQKNKTLAATEFFKLLNDGNYSESNVNKFSEHLNMTHRQITDIIVNIIGDKSIDDIFKINSQNVTDVLKFILEELSILSEAYENYKTFSTMFANYNNEMNPKVILATAFSPSSFITLNQSWRKNLNFTLIGQFYKDDNILNITDLTLASYQTEFLNISTLRLNNSYVNISSNYSIPLQNCSVVIYKNGKPIMVNTLNITGNIDYLYTNLERQNEPDVASPLICNNTIYGLATALSVNGSWEFRSLIKKHEPPSTSTITTTTPMTAINNGSTEIFTAPTTTTQENENGTSTDSSNSIPVFGSILLIAIFSLASLFL